MVTYNGLGGREIRGTELYDIEMVWGGDSYIMGGDNVTVGELQALGKKTTPKIGMVGGRMDGKIKKLNGGVIDEILKVMETCKVIETRELRGGNKGIEHEGGEERGTATQFITQDETGIEGSGDVIIG